MIQGLSIAGDVFWILALAIMFSMSWTAQKRIPAGSSVPIAFYGDEVTARAPRWAALWTVPALAFVVGGLLKWQSYAGDLTPGSAWIWLGVRVTVAPLLATLHLTRVRKGLEALDREDRL